MPVSPKYKYRPKFTPGQDDCVIQSFIESRSRITLGGTFFRSAQIGSSRNAITIENIWLTNSLDTGGIPIGAENVTTNITSINSVKFIVTEGTTVETYYEQQQQGTLFVIIPPPVEPVGTGPCDLWQAATTTVGNPGVSAIPLLRIQINTNSNIIEMPERGIDVNDGGMDDCYLEYFGPTNLSGADGGPDNPDTATTPIRTGPERSVIFISQTELDSGNNQPNNTGELSNITQKREWDGFSWII